MSSRAAKLRIAVDHLVSVVMELREAEKGDDTGLSLGELIHRERAAWGLSLQGLADKAGSTKAHIWDLEQGRASNPTVRTLLGLSDALRLPVIQLVNAAAATQRNAPPLSGGA